MKRSLITGVVLGLLLVRMAWVAWEGSRAARELGDGQPIAMPDAAQRREPVEQSLAIHLPLSGKALGTDEERAQLRDLQQRMAAAVVQAGTGELDGNEIAPGEYVMFGYGADADQLFSSLEVVLRASPLSKGGFVIKRYGALDDERALEIRLEL